MPRSRRIAWGILGLLAAVMLSGCAYNPFTDPNSYVGPGPVERVPAPLFEAPDYGGPGSPDPWWGYPTLN